MNYLKEYKFQIITLFLVFTINKFFQIYLIRNNIFFFYLLFLLLYIFASNILINSSKIQKVKKSSNKYKNLLIFLIYLLVDVITQNYYLNFETITWDTASYLVASQDISLGYIPFESSWESKGPLIYYIYYFLKLISLNNYVVFRLINDLLLFVIALIIFSIIYLKNNTYSISLVSGLFFLGLVSKDWYISEFTEIYCILILSICIYLKEKNSYIYIIPFLLSINSLINQGSILFIFPFFWWIFSRNYKEKFYKDTKYFLIYLTLPQVIVMSFYYKIGLLKIYLANYITIPINYSGKSESTLFELLNWLSEFHQYSNLLIIALITIFAVFTFENITFLKKFVNDFYFQCLIISILYYFIGSHNFYHHLFYFIFFSCFFIEKIRNIEFKILITILILLGVSVVTINTFRTSYNNLIDIEETQNNYPLYQLSNEIDSFFTNKNYTVLALDYVLVLNYLEKQNFSYIIHPTNHYEDYIQQPLIELGVIEVNNIEKLIEQRPDVILCNDTLTIRGQLKQFSTITCNDLYSLKGYSRLETGKYQYNWNLDLYKDSSKNMFVFIKQDS